MQLRFVIGAALVLAAQRTSAGDWPQWRGPGRDGLSPEKVKAAWPANGPPILWRALVGTGMCSVAVSQGRAYTLGNSNELDTIWCLAALTGKPLWRHTYPARLDPQWYEGGPGATPTVDAGRVFTISKWGDVFCLDAANGGLIWQHNLRAEGLKPNRWGFAGSPLVWSNLVIFNAGAAGIALDRDTGRVIWSTGPNATGYASPALGRVDGRELLLIFAAKALVALAPGTGRELWRLPFETKWDTNITDPIVRRDRLFLSSFSAGFACFALRDGPPQTLYTSTNLYNHLSPGIVLGDYLYAFSGEAKFTTDFRCLDLATGQVRWTRRDPAFGSLICADGKLLILSEKGELLLAAASPAGLEPLARAQILDPVCWTPPALANGLLYAKNARGALVCVELGGANGE